MLDDDAWARLEWLMNNPYAPVCPRCSSVYTYKYFLSTHGYGCMACGKDFGVVLKLR